MTVYGSVKDGSGKPVVGATVRVEREVGGKKLGGFVDDRGRYSIRLREEEGAEHRLVVSAVGYAKQVQDFAVAPGRANFDFNLAESQEYTGEVLVEDTYANDFGVRRLQSIEGANIYEAKKTEVIQLDQLTANKAVNNPRQLYARVPGLNIWESDGAGIQLGIGARGLDPNRTSHFNVRQNGYDISADALGYPESYYIPPAEALDRIEVVRGAASLQYGPQFGGLLNFVFKEGPDDEAVRVTSRQTVGSFGLYNSFNSVGGTVGKVNYYGFYHRRTGEGWRPNSGFDLNTLYGGATWRPVEDLSIKAEFTHMDYLAQQPGGLTDAGFEEDPQGSRRARNWFAVDWNLPALTLDYRFSSRTNLNVRSFALFASREALGNLNNIQTEDIGGKRTLMRDTYRNFGTEIRLLHRYELFGKPSALLVGARYYQGQTQRLQGNASADSDADFSFLPQNGVYSDYDFPNRNFSVFAENVFYLSDEWSITPGARLEHIRTEADGYFDQATVGFGGDTVAIVRTEDALESPRWFVLLGLGVSYKPTDWLEAYANLSQNYRSVTFSDLRRANLSIEVDPEISDESGYNFDFGLRGTAEEWLTFDFGAFYLRYDDRIGQTLRRFIPGVSAEGPPVYRTNIADAHTYGFELFTEANAPKLLGYAGELRWTQFVNFSHIWSEYLNSDVPGINGKQVEFVPPMTLRVGTRLAWKGFKLSAQAHYVARHFTDATNADDVSSSEIGEIPAYSVADLSAGYTYKWLTLEAGVQNLLDSRYFTRRATGYPGPGIIPSDARSFYVTLALSVGSDDFRAVNN